MIKVLYMGSPEEAIIPLKSLFDSSFVKVVGVVTPPPKPKKRTSQVQDVPVARWAKSQDLPLFQPASVSDLKFIGEIKVLSPDVAITCAYGMILPQIFLSIPSRGTINIHPSLLPLYRGASPVPWALWSGEKMTGVSLVQTVQKLDAGPIFSQKEVKIAPEENAKELLERLFCLSCPMLLDLLENFHGYRPFPQDEAKVTFSKKINKNMGLISWDQNAEQIFNQYRALTPWPSVFNYARGKRIIWKKLSLEEGRDRNFPVGPPRTIVWEDKGKALYIACQDSWIRILEMQVEGKKPMSPQAFYQGQGASWALDDLEMEKTMVF